MKRLEKWAAVSRWVMLGAALAGLPDASHAEQPCGPAQVMPVFDLAPGAEGLAVSRRGDVFVGNIGTGQIWLAPRGDFERASLVSDLIPIDHPFTFLLGMEVTSDGRLFAALNSFVAPQLQGLWEIARDGSYRKAASIPGSLLNDVAIDARGNVYVSDSLRGAIWRLTPEGQLELWSDSELLKGPLHPQFNIPFGVNGLTYHQGALYGAMYLEGRVVRISIGHAGTAGTPEVLVADGALVGADGIELDAEGNIYVTVNDADTLVRIDRRTMDIEPIATGGLSAPASLAVSPNGKTVYVANLGSAAPLPKPDGAAVVRVTLCTSADGADHAARDEHR